MLHRSESLDKELQLLAAAKLQYCAGVYEEGQ
jgi:hypothetical protein